MVDPERVLFVFPKYGSHSTTNTILFAISMTGSSCGMTMKTTRLTERGCEAMRW